MESWAKGQGKLGEWLTVGGFIRKKIFEQRPEGSAIMQRKNIPDAIASTKTLS